jgi:hypothetical protein
VDVGVAHQVIDQCQLRTPIVGKAAKMRDDEGDIRILHRQEFDGGDFADRVAENREREGARHFTADSVHRSDAL